MSGSYEAIMTLYGESAPEKIVGCVKMTFTLNSHCQLEQNYFFIEIHIYTQIIEQNCADNFFLLVYNKGSCKKNQAIEWGGGWGKEPAIKDKIIFFYFFLIVLPVININYFTLDNFSKYGHTMLKLVGRYFYWAVTIFSTNYQSFVPKIGEENKLSKSVSVY